MKNAQLIISIYILQYVLTGMLASGRTKKQNKNKK